MSDTLRTRIAAVIYNELREQSERDTAFPVMVGPAVGSPNFNGVALIDGEVDLDAAADAVIRKLGLKREELGGFRVPGYGHRGHRYVTEWTADE